MFLILTTSGINEMKQTNPSSVLWMTVCLGMLGLNYDFVQLKEVMIILYFLLLQRMRFCVKNAFSNAIGRSLFFLIIAFQLSGL